MTTHSQSAGRPANLRSPIKKNRRCRHCRSCRIKATKTPKA